MINKNEKIYVAGHNGMVGSAIVKNLAKRGYTNIVVRSSNELDLRNQSAVNDFFKVEKPEYVFLAAAKVGGIVANNTYRADFLYDNVMIQSNVIHASYLNNVKKLLFLGSSCIYPKFAKQPMKEDELLTEELEYTNEPYAIAKIAGLKLCESYNIQYGTNFISVMPTNLYGPNDNFNLENSHVLPAMIRKFYLGKLVQEDKRDEIVKDLKVNNWDEAVTILTKHGITQNPLSITLWGSGSPKREFLYVDDMADACVHIMEHVNFSDLINDAKNKKDIRNTHINIGTGNDISVEDLAAMIRGIIGFNGEVCWDSSKPDGTPRKLLDVTKIKRQGWKAETSLEEGIHGVFSWYKLKNSIRF